LTQISDENQRIATEDTGDQNNAGQKSPDEYPSARNFYPQQHPSNLLHAQDKEITMLSWNIWVLLTIKHGA
jgi:hypothetical protein